MQAIKIQVTTPTASRPARVKAMGAGGSLFITEYNHNLGLEENVKACLLAALIEWDWPQDYELGSLADGSYVAVAIPVRYTRAHDAVLLTRKAIREGDMVYEAARNSEWGQLVCDLTDGCQKDGFVNEYARSLSRAR